MIDLLYVALQVAGAVVGGSGIIAGIVAGILTVQGVKVR